MSNSQKSPYRGVIPTAIILCLPSILLIWLFHAVLTKYQPHFSAELNLAAVKFFGCGVGVLFHLSCLIAGAFKESFQVVKERIKEFFSNLSVSTSLAFKWYFDDLKTEGVVFWIYFAIVATNFGITISALFDFFSLCGARI